MAIFCLIISRADQVIETLRRKKKKEDEILALMIGVLRRKGQLSNNTYLIIDNLDELESSSRLPDWENKFFDRPHAC